MAYPEASKKTSNCYEDVIVGAMKYFTAEDWRYTDQSARKVIFRGRPRIQCKPVSVGPSELGVGMIVWFGSSKRNLNCI